MRGDKVRAEFEKQVLTDVPKQIEEQVQRLIDWLVQKDLQEWQRVMTYVQRRQALNIEHIVGAGIEPREMRRRELIDTMGKTVKRIVETYDRDREASELAAHVETAVAQTALLEVGAVGWEHWLRPWCSLPPWTSPAYWQPVHWPSLVFFVIPYKRKQAKDNFKEKMTSLRTNLLNTLTSQFKNESQGAVTRLKDGVMPYVRYVRSERERIEKGEAVLTRLRQRLSSLRARSQSVVGK
jgi:hypothetical protein